MKTTFVSLALLLASALAAFAGPADLQRLKDFWHEPYHAASQNFDFIDQLAAGKSRFNWGVFGGGPGAADQDGLQAYNEELARLLVRQNADKLLPKTSAWETSVGSAGKRALNSIANTLVEDLELDDAGSTTKFAPLIVNSLDSVVTAAGGNSVLAATSRGGWTERADGSRHDVTVTSLFNLRTGVVVVLYSHRAGPPKRAAAKTLMD